MPTASGNIGLSTASGWLNRPFPVGWLAGADWAALLAWAVCGAAGFEADPPQPSSSPHMAPSAPAGMNDRGLANIMGSLPFLP